MSHLKNSVAIITGGGSGIGFAIASSLVAEGMAVVIAGRDGKKLKGAKNKLEKESGKVLAVPMDVSVSAQVENLVKQTMDAYDRIDLLVNNAGIGKPGSIAQSTEAGWDETQAINLKGVFLCTKAVLPIMKRQRSGYVVNISSLAGKMGFGGMAAYSASKFGMVGLTESLLEEAIEDNIRATVICPGFVNTPMVRGASVHAKDMIPPEDIGQLVVGLLHLSPVTVIKEIVVQRKGAIGT
ncbi:MAG: SDR family oxidoreductase [Nitrospira sp.]|nr:SDR family oxidoreductase [Nitrospira sp.]